MCHQSVGLVQDAVESAGISTISLTVRPEITINLRVPRAAYVRFPTGNPVGQPNMPNQQRTILRGVLKALAAIEEPGTVLELPYRWKRMGDEDVAGARSAAVRADETPGTSDRAWRGEDISETRASVSEGGPLDGKGGVYARARAHVEDIQRRYAELMEELDDYRSFLEALGAEERSRERPDDIKLQAINPQLTYINELQRALEGPAHDGLVRVTDRVVRIRHWEEGVFL